MPDENSPSFKKFVADLNSSLPRIEEEESPDSPSSLSSAQNTEDQLCSKDRVAFPREPYKSQRQLAEAIYSACKDGSVAIFESPTGTGKSLAVLCGSLSFLVDYSYDKQRVEEKICNLQKQRNDVTEDKSIGNNERFKRLHMLKCELDELEEQVYLQKRINVQMNELPADTLLNEALQDKKNVAELGSHVKKLIYVSRTHSQLTQFIREMNNPLHRSRRPVQIGSRASMCLNQNVNGLPAPLVNCECARLVRNASLDIEDINDGEQENIESNSLQKATKRDTCPYYKRTNILQLRSRIWKGVLLDDLTTIKHEGRKIAACPFFAAKAALPLCDVIAMPYNLLFDKISRDAYGVHLKDSVVVVDEAHNFLSTVHESASFTLNLNDLELAQEALQFYLDYTRSTRQEKLLVVRQIITALERFVGLLRSKEHGDEIQLLDPVDILREMATTSDYLKLATRIETMGLIRESRGILSRYWTSLKSKSSQNKSFPTTSSAGKLTALAEAIRQSKLQKEEEEKARLATEAPQKGVKRVGTPMPSKMSKLRRFGAFSEPATPLHPDSSSTPSVSIFKQPIVPLKVDGVQLFGSIIKLFRSLLQSESAKFIFNTTENQVRYVQLDINSDLQRVIESSRAFIMVGGTMRPRGYISSVLKSTCKVNNIVEQQFGHVVPASNLLPLVISTDAQNNPLTLKVSQLDDKILRRYAETLNSLVDYIPYGCVVFLPNYNVIQKFYNILRSLEYKKELFVEQRGQDVDVLIRRYSQFAAKSHIGAILLASASGRLSEGLNFSDHLARAVVMIGMPYPNAKDLETDLRAKHAVEQKLSSDVYNYLSQTCTRIIAQCMGRAIRHAKDFAALIFMDSRYDSGASSKFSEIVSNLPRWMTKDMQTMHPADFSTTLNNFFDPLLADFEKQKKEKTIV